MAGTELVVGVSADSNNFSRKLLSALGGRITFDGGGGSVGQTPGLTAGPLLPQAEVASAQVSSNSSRDGLGRIAVFLMGLSDFGHLLGLGMLSGTGVVDLLHSSGRGASLLPGICGAGPIPAPRPAGGEASDEQEDGQAGRYQRAAHGVTPRESSMMRMLIAS